MAPLRNACSAVALLLVSLTALHGNVASALDPAFLTNITVYHVFPNDKGIAPVNMDTADLQGDMYFDLRSVLTPMECAHPSSRSAHDCDNPEVVSPNLVISKVLLEVDSRFFGQYGRCNICVNGTDNHGNNSCTNGAYWCDCGEFGEPPVQCNASVGRIELREEYGHRSCESDHGQLPPVWDCWRDATAVKTCIQPPTGGYWYSTTSMGYCGDGRYASKPGCTWRVVEEIKRINKTCSDNSVYSEVEKNGQDCFSTCGGVGVHRNTSSSCWITCFYNTVLGPNAGTPGGEVAGMPFADLMQAWETPFASDDPSQGGCPRTAPQTPQK